MDDALSRLIGSLGRPGAESSDYDLNPGYVPPPGRKLSPAGVLVAIEQGAGGPTLVLTKRASGLKHRPGQIAFPGGKVDPSDRDSTSAALREAREEIGLDPRQVRVLGTLPRHETVTGFDVTPVLGLIEGAFDPVAEPSEVDEAFSVPLAFVANRAHFGIERRLWRGQWRSYFTLPYGPYYIWGATARILRMIADRMA